LSAAVDMFHALERLLQTGQATPSDCRFSRSKRGRDRQRPLMLLAAAHLSTKPNFAP
jgi:hypothetical protein